MNIEKKANGSKVTFIISGRLDTNTAPEFERAVKSSVDGTTELVFEFKDLEYISSAGLRVLLSSQKTMNRQGKMKVRNINRTIAEIFEVTGFNEILTIE